MAWYRGPTGKILRRADFGNKIARSADCCCGLGPADYCLDIDFSDPFSTALDDWTWHGLTNPLWEVTGGRFQGAGSAYVCRGLLTGHTGRSMAVQATAHLNSGEGGIFIQDTNGFATGTPSLNLNNVQLLAESGGPFLPISYKAIWPSGGVDTEVVAQDGDVLRIEMVQNGTSGGGDLLHDVTWYRNGGVIHSIAGEALGFTASGGPATAVYVGVIGLNPVEFDNFSYTTT